MDLTIFIWIAALAAAALLAWVAAVFASRHIKQQMSAEPDEAFTLQDLRELRAAGKITEEEFTNMRAAIIGSFDKPKPVEAPDRTSELEDLLRFDPQRNDD